MILLGRTRRKQLAHLRPLLALTLSVFMLAACGGPGSQVRDAGEAPEWFDNPLEGCGVGSATHRGVRSLTRDAAVTNARADLAKQIKTHVASMLKTYAEQGSSDNQEFSEELQTRVTRDVTDMGLHGTKVAKTQLMDGEMYAVVCLDPETFASAFDRMNDLSKKAREALKKRAQAEFKDLAAQIEKLRAR